MGTAVPVTNLLTYLGVETSRVFEVLIPLFQITVLI